MNGYVQVNIKLDTFYTATLYAKDVNTVLGWCGVWNAFFFGAPVSPLFKTVSFCSVREYLVLILAGVVVCTFALLRESLVNYFNGRDLLLHCSLEWFTNRSVSSPESPTPSFCPAGCFPP